MNLDVKEAAKKGAELWAAKKGMEWTGSLLKLALVAGVGYYAYKLYQKNSDDIKEMLS